MWLCEGGEYLTEQIPATLTETEVVDQRSFSVTPRAGQPADTVLLAEESPHINAV